jgi:hypothetical protein
MAARTAGLLTRASAFHGRSKPVRDEDEGITAAERRDILASIDQVAIGNRINRGASRAAIVARKKGFVFPLVVNLIVILVTGATILALAFIFRERDQSIEAGSVVVTSAEGKLIQEIKRESDSKLQEKDRAISDIQGRLSSIDKQRSDLVASFEQRIALREAELRSSLKAELDREKQRLTDLGLSESAIQSRLKKFEAEKMAEYNSQLEAFKKQAAADKAAVDARLAQARDEYQKNISGLNDERRKILDDAKSREDQLRATMDAKTKELEGQSAAAQASLAKAQSDLSRLEDQRSRAQATEDRTLGLYGSIRTSLRDRRYEDALASITNLESYLNDPSVLAIPAIQARRAADLFVADALRSLARTELERTSVDSTKLLIQAELLASARDASAAGDKALKAGDFAAAAARYRDSLATVPEILAAHDYFMNRARDEEAARRARLDTALAEADRAWKSGDAEASVGRYAEALSALSLDEGARSAMLARIGQAGAESAAKAGKAADSRAARESLAVANRSLAAGRWNEAIAGYIGLVASWPAAEQVSEALKGIGAARAGMDRDYEARAAAYEKTIADLKAEAQRSSDAFQEQIKTFSSSLQESRQGMAVYEKRLSDARAEQAASEKRLVDSRQESSVSEQRAAASEQRLAEARAQVQSSQDEIDRLQKQLAAVQSATAQAGLQAGTIRPADAASASAGDLKALAELRAQVGGLKQEYAAYLEAENVAAAKTGDSALLARQKRLAAFLGGNELKALFPELGGLVDSQITAYHQQISLETLRTAADIAIQATKAKTAAERGASLDSNARHYADDPTILGFINALREMLR